MVDWVLIVLIALFTGVIVKYCDILEDDRRHQKLLNRIVLGMIYGFVLFFMVARFEFLAPLWIGIVLGLLMIGKIDAPSHYAGVSVFLVLLAFRGLSSLNLFLLILFIAVCVLEEMLNDHIDAHPIKKIQKLIEARPLLEITAFFVSLLTGNWYFWLALLSLDVGYIFTTKLIK